MKQQKAPQQTVAHLTSRISSLIRSNQILATDDRIIVGVSGGADSLALLHILNDLEISLELIAVYVDHGLRPAEIPLEIDLIEQFCNKLGVQFLSKTIDVKSHSTKQKRSIEESGRILRYECFENLRKQFSAHAIAVAHHADDQVEEFFLRVLRGSSRKSLSGMALQNGYLIRPLLQEKKATLHEYLESKNVNWCVDSSNLEKEYLRNRVRHDLLPLLRKEFNPSIARTVLQNMEVLREEELFLDRTTTEAYQKCVNDVAPVNASRNDALTIKSDTFDLYHLAIQRRILEKCCWQLKTRPSYEQICSLIELFECSETGKQIHLLGGLRVEKEIKHLVFSKPLPEGKTRGSAQPTTITGQNIPSPGAYSFKEINKTLIIEEVLTTACKIDKPDVLHVDRDIITFPLYCRISHPGERFHPLGAPGSKKVSRYLNDKKIPAKHRASCPVLVKNDQIIALPGLQIDERYKLTQKTKTALRIRWVSTEK